MDGIPRLVYGRTTVLLESRIREDPDGLQDYEGGEWDMKKLVSTLGLEKAE